MCKKRKSGLMMMENVEVETGSIGAYLEDRKERGK